MNSKNIFDYSDEFLKEIIQDIIGLKIQNLSNPKSNEFSNRLKQIVGKSFEETEIKELVSAKDNEIKVKITNKFLESRHDRIKLLGENHAKEIEKRIFLQSIDLNWKSHIQYLEQLRQVIGLRSYGQRDPLIEYKKEAFDLFSNLLEKLKLDFVTILMNLKVVTEQPQEEIEPKQSMVEQIKSGKKIGRNEPCSCGSGKKFKHCCGAL
jgi:preprotein translocase subunit SecA